jgi:hypothetical protein
VVLPLWWRVLPRQAGTMSILFNFSKSTRLTSQLHAHMIARADGPKMKALPEPRADVVNVVNR